eukprot:Opistho-2@24128
MRPLIALAAIVAAVVWSACNASALSTAALVTPLPIEVTYDGRALIIGGERQLIVSGSIHYPRSTPEMWPDILALAKTSGVNMIQTYVFWNSHEPVRGQYDFSDNLDLVRFLRECQRQGLWVNLRIGPYVCAEWNFGGFPEWLRRIDGIEFRTYNQPYMLEMERWVRFIVDKVSQEGLFAPQGGPIVIAQIENEYGNVEASYGDGGKKYVQWCANLALSMKIDVPWIMCQQEDAPAPIVNTCNGFYCDGFRPSNKNAFNAFTENWPGWFQLWSEPRPHRPSEDVAFSVARFYARGGTLSNYYMYHGGTNFGRTVGGPFITTSYDYDVSIDEYGRPSEPKYSHLAALHALLQKHRHTIVGVDVPPTESLGGSLEAHTYNATVAVVNGTCIAFLSNPTTTDAKASYRGATYTLPAWSVSILDGCEGEVVYNTATITHAPSVRTYVPTIRLTEESFAWVEEPLGADASAAADHSPIVTANAPIEQLTLTNDTTDYVWYAVDIPIVKATDGANVTVELTQFADFAYVFLGSELSLSGGQAGPDASFALAVNATSSLEATTVTLNILTTTLGLTNYGAFLEKITRGILGKVLVGGAAEGTNSTWRHSIGLWGERQRLYAVDADARHVTAHVWKTGPVPTDAPNVWMRALFATPDGNNPVVLDLKGLSKGMAWINGRSIGRYWLKMVPQSAACNACDYRGAYSPDKCRTGCEDYSQRYYHVPREWLSADGRPNTVVLFDEQKRSFEDVAVATVLYAA